MTVDTHAAIALTTTEETALEKLAKALIDQEKATIVVPAQQASTGFWFGGGNIVQAPDGSLLLCGRYRNYGDSRTGLGVGERGLECAIFQSNQERTHFEKKKTFTKEDLSQNGTRVISIEGTALHWLPDGRVEFFISMEKARDYPRNLASYQKPGTGVWVIDRMVADSIEALSVDTLETILENTTHPEYLHIKDPFVFDLANGDTVLGFCTHPFTWSSSNTGFVLRKHHESTFGEAHWETARRGTTWDVAVTRITNRLKVPAYGAWQNRPNAYLYFYDGAECMRQLDENPHAHSRPRGYSCEELGGLLVGAEVPDGNMVRLSRFEPLFVSPYGTGSSRYVSTLVLEDGIIAIWQQSQPDQSQPLVMRFLPMADVQQILEGATD